MAGVVADRVIVELEAKLDRYNANVRAAEARFNTATRNIERNAKQAERQMAASTGAIGSQLRGLAATFAAAFSVQQVARFADSYTRYTNQLKVAGVEGERLGRVQDELFSIAQRYGVELEGLGGLFGKLTQAQKELGASNAELLKFTNGVAAALKIQGGAASESRGALIQLTQALGGEIVRAEEFNSINEGARPILQAVANGIDRFGGSVAKLRREVVDGKLRSDEFFQGFLRGSAQLEEKATKANLTIGASFTVLNNALGKYIGETDASLSATERVSAAIIKLSENLDTIVGALGVLAAILGARYIAAAVGAARATGVVGTALFAMQARAVGAATSMEALALAGTTAGRALLAAFGGPVGLAVLALTAGIYYLTTRTEEGTQASGQYVRAQAAVADIAKRAADATDTLATATGRARGEAIANAKALQQETIQYIANAKAATLAAKAKYLQVQADARADVQNASRSTRGAGGGTDPLAIAASRGNKNMAQAEANLRQATANLESGAKALNEINAALAAPPAVRAPSVDDGKKKKTKTKAGPKGTDPDEIARRFADDLARGQIEYASAVAEVIGSLEARLDVERQRTEVERLSNERAIKADKDLTDAQRAKLLEINNQIAHARQEAIDAEERRQLAEDEITARTEANALAQDMAQAQGALARTTAERKAAELRLLDLQEQEERIRLEAIRDNEKLRDVEREAARRRLAELSGIYGAKREGVDREYEGPGAKYARELADTDPIAEMEKAGVRGLQALEDQLTTTIGKVFELGGAFGKIANQIISDLIRIAVQKAIIGPLANALFGGGDTMGGLLGSILGGGKSTPPIVPQKRAGGGHVVAGRLYRVNDGGGSGIEGFQPAGSGKIIPLGRMNRAGGGDTIISQRFVLDARYGITTPELLAHVNSLATQRAATAGRAAFKASQDAMPARLGRYSKLGK